ncbi:MAG: amidohydrolase [Candidatus Eisenbacteria bacterium]|nr:amidohydrolase [Candidatus Eisenbacteria bacterium]
MQRSARRQLPAVLLLTACLLPSAAGAKPDFASLAETYGAKAIEYRRHFHRHPELSLREHETQSELERILAAVPGVELAEGDWGTGVAAVLHGERNGGVVAWRADMDALPITEETGLPFASTLTDTLRGGRMTGVMHACGHDNHMGIALAAAQVLSEVRAELPGRVLFIMQPGEEIGAGAYQMLEAGLFDGDLRPHCVLALHVHPTIPAGMVGSCPGPSTANVDGFRLRILGAGGHGAYPHQAKDPVTLAARMILALQSIVTREIDVNRHCVISVGKIEGGAKSNVIPDDVVIEATVRSQDDATRNALKEKIRRTLNGLADAAGAPRPELEYYFGTPAGYNDPELVAQCREVFRRVLGPENEDVYDPAMGGEDFAYFGREVPGFQFRLGVGRPDREMSLHNKTFDPDERAIPIGVRLASELIWDQLQRAAAGEGS